MTYQPSRRQFLKKSCLIAAAVGVTVCGGGAAAATYQPPIDLPSKTFGDKAMNNRILITYASKAGSTAEIAARMGEKLSQGNVAVDVLPINKVTDLTPYNRVVLGSAIRVGQLLPEALTFIQKNQATLQQKPISVFIVCMTLKEDNEANRKTVSAYLDPVRALIKPASEGLFAGAVISNKLGLLDRLIMMAMKVPEGDFRQWSQIESWTDALPAL